MAWFVLARVLFVAAVTYSAILLRPFHADWIPNAAFGVGAGVAAGRLRDPAQEHVGHAHARRHDRRRHRPGGIAKTIGAALFWANTRTTASPSCTRSSLLALTVPRPADGRAQGRVARADAARRAVPVDRTAAPLPHPRHQRDHRRPRRRHLRDRLSRRHARRPAVRAQGAAAGRRLGRLAQAQPRPPRPRHPAEDAEDGRPRRDDLGPRLSRRSARWISS